VYPYPLGVELMNDLNMLPVVIHFAGGFDVDGDFVNYINRH
jgi:hypothetical protein